MLIQSGLGLNEKPLDPVFLADTLRQPDLVIVLDPGYNNRMARMQQRAEEGKPMNLRDQAWTHPDSDQMLRDAVDRFYPDDIVQYVDNSGPVEQSKADVQKLVAELYKLKMAG